MKLLKQLAMAVAFVWPTVSPATPQDHNAVVQGSDPMEGCRTLTGCLRILDQLAKSTRPGVFYADHERIGPYLQQFGEPAKQAMFMRANGNDPQWRALAGDVLAGWPSFMPEDVPALKSALTKTPGDMVARALAKIPTPEAIDALIEDVREHGPNNQSSFALTKIGARIFPNLVRALENDRNWDNLTTVLWDLKDECKAQAPTLAQNAVDLNEPLAKRLASLRALDGCGYSARAVGPQIAPLLRVSQTQIRDLVAPILLQMKDSAVLSELVKSCVDGAERENRFADGYDFCANDIASFGTSAQAFGPDLMALTTVPNGQARAWGAALLGYIDYQPAASALAALLDDADWRVVYAAARSLSWLKAKGADAKLLEVSRRHWLPEVRQIALDASQSFQPGGKTIPKPLVPDRSPDSPPRPNLEVNALQVPDIMPCKSGRWRYRELLFAEPSERKMEIQVPSSGKNSGGTMRATDRGEFGGGLFWVPENGAPETLYSTNSVALAPTNDGAIAAFGEVGMYVGIDENGKQRTGGSNGPSGYGFVLWTKRDDKGEWALKEIARLPRSPDVITDVGHNRFAAWVGGRAVVFNLHGIEGVATCE